MRLVLLLVGALFSATMSAEETDRSITAGNVSTFFDSALAVLMQDHKVAGAVVSVVYQGELLFKAGYGWADLEQRVAADPDRSLFRIASITKPFVWTAIMQLAEQGLLDIEDPIDDYLDFPIPATYSDPIRIKHLLTHTPGFEELGTGNTARTAAQSVPLGEHLADSIPARVRPPGEQAAYSNYGASLAGYIVERVTGLSWADYVDQHVLAPLNMHSTNTQQELSADFEARHAIGYRFSGGRFVPTEFEWIRGYPAGFMSATADDMSRFMLAHLNFGEYQGKRILDEATARQMRQPLFDPHAGIPPMLHGFFRSDRNGLEIFGHGGDVNQFHSSLSLIPSVDLGVFISFNSDPGAAARNSLFAGFIDHFFPVEYLRPVPEAVVLSLDEYVGEYLPLRRGQSTFERAAMLVNNLSIGVQGDELIVGSSRWTAVGQDRFTARYRDRLMVFERDGQGQVSHVVIGSPLSTFERVRGLDAPGTIRAILIGNLLLALFAVVGYGYRIVRRAPESKRLATIDVATGWFFSLSVLGLYVQFAQMLSSSTEAFSFGMPTAAHVSLLLMNLNILIGMAVVIFSARQWMTAAGSTGARLRYSALAVGVIGYVWIAWYFNFIGYLFT